MPYHLKTKYAAPDEAKDLLEKSSNILIEGGNKEGFETLENISKIAKIEKKSEFEKLFEIITENKKKTPNNLL